MDNLVTVIAPNYERFISISNIYTLINIVDVTSWANTNLYQILQYTRNYGHTRPVTTNKVSDKSSNTTTYSKKILPIILKFNKQSNLPSMFILIFI